MSHIDFPAFDADNHYYEAEDAFTRHIEPKMQRRAMQWGVVNGRKCLLVAGKVNRFIPNPTFDPVAKPGCLDQYFRGSNPDGKSIREVFGDLEPINPAYRDRDARIALMDTQGLEGMFMFPTLGVGMEESLKRDPEALCAAFRAFNRWMSEDWGFAYKERLFAAPYITLVDVDNAVRELEWALDHDARAIVMRAGPVETPAGGHNPADARFDPFWSRVAEAGITAAYHSGDSGYLRFFEAWGLGGEFQSFDFNPLRLCMSPAPIMDTMAALVCGGLFDRHPRLRIATIETGSSWVAPLLARFEKAYGQMPFAFQQDPVEAFRKHVWVAPYYEDDLPVLRDAIGADRILFGSDFPHGEGLAEPTEFVNDLEGFSAADTRLVMRENGMSLIRPSDSVAAPPPTESPMAETDVLRGPHILEYPYKRSLGPVLSRFFTSLADRQFEGIKTRDGKVLVPPQEYDPHSGEPLSEWVPVGPGGEIVSWSWVAKPRKKQPLQHPFAYALIRLDGADVPLLHAVDASSESKLAVGARVVPRWAAEPKGGIGDVVCFDLEKR